MIIRLSQREVCIACADYLRRRVSGQHFAVELMVDDPREKELFPIDPAVTVVAVGDLQSDRRQ